MYEANNLHKKPILKVLIFLLFSVFQTEKDFFHHFAYANEYIIIFFVMLAALVIPKEGRFRPFSIQKIIG